VEATPADRTAAADLVRWQRGATAEWKAQDGDEVWQFFVKGFSRAILQGIWDEHPVVQAFAEHRIAALSTPEAGHVTRLAHELRERSRFPSGQPRISPDKAHEIAEASLEASDTKGLVEALERINQFITQYREPWGSWKTAWWEGEVSDDAAFTDDNAIMHCANIVRKALAQHRGSTR
jgi:hypothetical protein